ncbi:MAG: hypothetical protein ACC618_04410 [Patescibacteria group bacterium]
MQAILEELKGSMGGIIGSFVIGEGGTVIAQDVPQIMSKELGKVSMTLYHGTKVIKESHPVDKLTIDSESTKLISVDMGNRLLVVIAEKNVNIAIFKLFSNMIISKLKEIPSKEVKPPVQEKVKAAEDETPAKERPAAPDYDVEAVFTYYNTLFSKASSKLLLILGPGATKLFDKKLDQIPKKYQKIFTNVKFGSDGKLNLAKIKLNTRQVSKEELIAGLEEALSKMIEAVRETSGSKMGDKLLDEINKIKEENKENI